MPHQHNMTAPVTQQTRDCNSQALLTSKRKKYPISWIPLDNKLKWKHISTSYIIKSENSMYAFEKEFFQRTQVWMKKIRSHHFLRDGIETISQTKTPKSKKWAEFKIRKI